MLLKRSLVGEHHLKFQYYETKHVQKKSETKGQIN
jgi:hypothetical protein